MKMPNFDKKKLKYGLIPPHPTIYYRRVSMIMQDIMIIVTKLQVTST